MLWVQFDIWAPGKNQATAVILDPKAGFVHGSGKNALVRKHY